MFCGVLVAPPRINDAALKVLAGTSGPMPPEAWLASLLLDLHGDRSTWRARLTDWATAFAAWGSETGGLHNGDSSHLLGRPGRLDH